MIHSYRMGATNKKKSYHELLGIDSGASYEDILNGYRKAKELFSPQNPHVKGHFKPSELKALNFFLDEAFEKVSLQALSNGNHIAHPDISSLQKETETDIDCPEVTPIHNITISGKHLRDERIQQGISLEEINKTTKISLLYLEALEKNDSSRLPSKFFIRNYVKQVAQILNMKNPNSIADRYLQNLTKSES